MSFTPGPPQKPVIWKCECVNVHCSHESGSCGTKAAGPQEAEPVGWGTQTVVGMISPICPTCVTIAQAPEDESFDTTWQRVAANAGAMFTTTTGIEFTYTVVSNSVCPDHVNQKIGRAQFEKCAKMLREGSSATDINNGVRGSSYVRAILEDRRVQG
jgi:hypothetical protein